MADIWSEALHSLQPRLGAQTFDMWLRPIALQEIRGHALHLHAPNRFMKEWFENHYLRVVLDEIKRLTQSDYTAQIEVSDVSAAAVTTACEAPTVESQPLESAPAPAPATKPRLSERYRFDNYIKGTSNELAASAAWSAAQEPGKRFNPLFIYGGCGLGKTHLLHAIGRHISKHRPELRICYLSAEQFMNEFISAVRCNQFDAFRSRYRHDNDVLLIDDIQFIAGRDRTMDEFFHVFNVLYEAGKQIVVTADRVPADMSGMEERLTSRLNWGLVADIQAPDLETRAAILRQKADHDHIRVDTRVLLHIANLVRSNVRELEGALMRVAAFAELRGVRITEAFVSEVLGGVTPSQKPVPVTIEHVQKLVASHFSVKIADLKGPRRHRSISRPRMIAMYLSRELTGASFPEIGQRFGGKDHSTVINACKRITSIQASEPEMRTTVTSLREQLASQSLN